MDVKLLLSIAVAAGMVVAAVFEWTFLRSAFVPYHSGLSWFVSCDGAQETHIRMQSTPEEQGMDIRRVV